jgi:hypothetical protein
MKPIRVFTLLATVLLVTTASIATSHAQPVTFTYEDGVKPQVFANGRAIIFGDTTLNMQTEEKGGWLPNNTYQVNWTLSLESLTPGFLNGTDFYILVYWSPLADITPTIPAQVVVNQTELSLTHKTGTISAAFTPTNTSEGFYMNPDFPFVVYVNGEPSHEKWASGVWHGGVGVSTNVLGNTETMQPTVTQSDAGFPTLTVITLAILAVLLIFTGYAITRKRNPSRISNESKTVISVNGAETQQ